MIADVTINSDLIVAMSPIAVVMIVGLMTWIVRELSRVSTAVDRIAERQQDQGKQLDAQDATMEQHIKDDAVVATKVAYIEGRMRRSS